MKVVSLNPDTEYLMDIFHVNLYFLFKKMVNKRKRGRGSTISNKMTSIKCRNVVNEMQAAKVGKIFQVKVTPVDSSSKSSSIKVSGTQVVPKSQAMQPLNGIKRLITLLRPFPSFSLKRNQFSGKLCQCQATWSSFSVAMLQTWKSIFNSVQKLDYRWTQCALPFEGIA